MLFIMQALIRLLAEDFQNVPYAAAMQKFGTRLAAARRAAGLSQNDLAAKLGVPQSNISFWERWDKPPRGEVLPELAAALSVGLDELLGVTPPKPKRTVAQGRLQKVFEQAGKLPRRQQEKIAEVVAALVAQHGKAA